MPGGRTGGDDTMNGDGPANAGGELSGKVGTAAGTAIGGGAGGTTGGVAGSAGLATAPERRFATIGTRDPQAGQIVQSTGAGPGGSDQRLPHVGQTMFCPRCAVMDAKLRRHPTPARNLRRYQ
jgi:hypothetical protein